MTDHFTQHALSWGEAGKQWLKSLPNLIEVYQKRWSFIAQPPFNLNYNYVAPVKRLDGSEAVLKIGFPQDKEFQTEMKALELFAGQGIAKLLEADPKNSIMLLEHVLPGKSLSELDDDAAATKILTQVMKKLWKPLPNNHGFITVQEWSSAIPEFRKKFGSTSSSIPSYLVEKAETLFQELITTSAQPVLIHGDLHHDNVLRSDRDDWLAIDPKGIAAEPAYEVAAMIRNPYEKLKAVTDLEPILRQRIMIFAEELKIDAARLHQWCLAQTVLSAVWNVGTSKGPEHAVKVAKVLAGMEI